jgi:hypothetical protein
MCQVYRVAGDLTEVLVSLAAETKSKGWWHSYGDAVPDWFELYVGLEAAARRLRQYEPGLVPGLLQTREYAAAIIATAPNTTDTQVERKVALRLERQRILTRRAPKPPQLEVILDEAVLRRPLADRSAMKDQLTRLAFASNAPNLSVRIVPSSVGPHRSLLGGAFVILDFPSGGGRPTEPSTVYSEGLTGALYLDKPHEVAVFEMAWKVLGDLALDVRESQNLITTIIDREY